MFRTVPFVAKAVGHPIAKYASLLMSGKTLKEVGLTEEPLPTKHVAVKEVVLPFNKFPGGSKGGHGVGQHALLRHSCCKLCIHMLAT